MINRQGEIVEEHFGEGNYAETEALVAKLLGTDVVPGQNIANDNLEKIGSPEMYFGTDRLANLDPEQNASLVPASYNIGQNLNSNTFSLGGKWQFLPSDVQLAGNSGQINLKFHSGKIYMVASSAKPATLTIIVDGKPQPQVIVQDSKLYTLFDSEDYSDHFIEIKINQPGFKGFTFTFG